MNKRTKQEKSAKSNLQVKCDFFNKKIEDMQLSIRTINVLNLLKIKTIEDLIFFSQDELSKCRAMGNKSIYEIKSKLKELNLTLKNDPMPWTPKKWIWYDLKETKPPEEEKLYLIAYRRSFSKKLSIKISRWAQKSYIKWNWYSSSIKVKDITHFMVLPDLPLKKEK